MNAEDMIDLLDSVGGVTPRKMFGGTGFYKNGIMFALEASGRLYVKVDEVSKERVIDAGCEPFVFETKDGRHMSMSYYEPPESAFSSPMRMKPWAILGVEASLRAAKPKAKKKVKAKAEKKATTTKSAKSKTALIKKQAAKTTEKRKKK
jgi:DNA transformation protein